MRGELRLLPHNQQSATLESIDRVALVGSSGDPRWIRIVGRRRHKKFILLRFEDVTSVEGADRLIGLSVAVPRDRLPELAEGETYHIDLIGCSVVTDTGEALGSVAEIMQTGSNDVLVVRGQGPGGSSHGPDGSRESLIPLIDDVVVDVDVDAARILIHVVPGLLDAG